MAAGAVRVLFFGTPAFTVPSLQELHRSSHYEVAAVVTQPDRPAGRGAKLRPSPVKRFALENGIPCFQPTKIRGAEEEFQSELAPYAPFQVGVVVAFGQILPEVILEYPQAGCVNVHASLLPRWRGAAPIHRAVLAGDKETGVCLMKMEAGLDTGPVYQCERLAIAAEDTSGDLHDRLSEEGARLLERHLQAIAAGELIAEPQPEEGVTYAKKITNEEARIDFQRPAGEVVRTIHGLSPFPGAFTFLDGKRLKVSRAREVPERPGGSVSDPGTIHHLDRETLEVNCGEGVAALEELQLEGKRRLSVGEFLAGVELDPSLSLGETSDS